MIRMKFRNYLVLILLFLFQGLSAQIKNPVKLTYEVLPVGENQYEAVITAKMESGWHIYSKDLPPDSGIPTELIITSKEGIELIGGTVEVGKKHDEFSEAFGAQIVYYSNSAKFKQKFRLKTPARPATIMAEFTYQTCDDRVCLAPNTIEFEKTIPGDPAAAATIATVDEPEQTAENTIVGDSETPEAAANTKDPVSATALDPKELKISSLDYQNPLTDCGETKQQNDENYLTYLILGFLGGMIALLTPCVFPMIPLTVSFFTKGNKNKSRGIRDAMTYGFFIFAIFTALSIPFHLIDGIAGNIFNQISTSVGLNLFFFAVFMIFAFSFFGYFDITLPSSIANRSSKAEEAGGLIGIFFMALTLVIVSFSCTGPILGSLLGSAVTGSANVPMLLTFALAGFGLAWAIVFGILALFPQALQSLPKSGGWMNTVKVFLGFVELGLALKFLSKADLVSKTFLLKRELFIVLWIIITIGIILYLFGLIRFPHDDKKAKISTGRKAVGLLSIGFLVYLVQGLIPGERPKLQMLSGILPPLNVSYFHDVEDGILGMKPEHDYFEAVQTAQRENKPILIDFTGYGCENCRKMEEFVWSEPDILPILQNDVILTSLYVDDKEELPEEQQTRIDMGNGQMKRIKTIGDRWSLFQQVNFNDNTQPVYVLVTPDGKVINHPFKGYNSDKEVFKKFLQCGINYYKNSY